MDGIAAGTARIVIFVPAASVVVLICESTMVTRGGAYDASARG